MDTKQSNDMESPLNRADETAELLDAVKALIIPFIQRADQAAAQRAAGGASKESSSSLATTTGTTTTTTSALIAGDLLPPKTLQEHLTKFLSFSSSSSSSSPHNKDAVLAAISQILTYSVNTWDQGFLDKLYSSPTPIGLVAELLLATLNTNVHVYSVAPALTIVEKHTATSLARLLGFTGPHAGGFTVPGGSASNLTSLVIARNHYLNLHPPNSAPQFVAFTSAHAHYSLSKASTITTIPIRPVPVDPHGAMHPASLAAAITQARADGLVPLYVNATAGTTVLGAYDPLDAIAHICARERLWLHVDASWGGPVCFSPTLAQRQCRLKGIEKADSVALNPHKMLQVPVTCSFLVGGDVRVFHRANRIDAPYLFHGDDNDEDGQEEVWDLADMTLQCGRRGDALKLALAWLYYGTDGLRAQVEGAFTLAQWLAREIKRREPVFALVNEDIDQLPCLQVCFYYRYNSDEKGDDAAKKNTATTVAMVKRLRSRGFMVDYATFPPDFRSGRELKTWKGSFFRVVVNTQTRKETLVGLVTALEEVGREIQEQT